MVRHAATKAFGNLYSREPRSQASMKNPPVWYGTMAPR